jgi:hypothetical protein
MRVLKRFLRNVGSHVSILTHLLGNVFLLLFCLSYNGNPEDGKVVVVFLFLAFLLLFSGLNVFSDQERGMTFGRRLIETLACLAMIGSCLLVIDREMPTAIFWSALILWSFITFYRGMKSHD